jgi:hypothetical protein
MKLTYGDIKNGMAKVLSLPDTDSRVIKYVNEAQERLVYKGKWPGTYVRYAVTSSNGTITWPRQLETVEAVAVGDSPAVVRNEWYEFLESGPGLLDSADGDQMTLIDRADAVSFSDIDGLDKKLKVVTKSDTDAGKTMILQGYDENGDWIRTLDGSNHIDGEKVTLVASSTSVTTNSKFSALSGVIRDKTNYNVLLKEHDTADTTDRTIAEYEPTETRPIYRRSLIPGLPDTSTITVTVVGKLRFSPAINDDDWLYINFESALKLMVMALRKEETNNIREAVDYEAQAIQLLNDQLQHYMGDGVVAIPRFINNNTFGGAAVTNFQ